MSIQLIETSEQLSQFCQRAESFCWIGLDTEFIRERTYRPKLCLVQISTEDEIVCIDPLAIDDLSPMYALLNNPKILKVLHAATQDLEIFYLATGIVPAPIFDTQIAGALLGLGDQAGYARLVEAVCKKTLDKSQSHTDWSKRPLSTKQIQYAGDDVNYLRDVYLYMQKELTKHNRLDWIQSDFDALTQPSKYEPNMPTLWKRVRQHNRLKGVQLMILSELAQWREHIAIENDKPRKWVASDDLLLDLSKIAPSTLGEMSRIRGADDGFIKRYGSTLMALIQKAKNTPKEQWPELPKYKKLNANQDAMCDYLMSVAKLKAQEHSISLASLVSKKQLDALILGDENVEVMKSWRHHLLGKHLKNVLEGRESLTWENGVLSLIEHH